jgi:microcystin-dependent protein
MKKSTALTLALLALCAESSMATCSGPDSAYIGSVCYMASTYCPDGYEKADGKIYQVAQYQALYSLIGNMYGGTGPTTFAVPDLSGRYPVGSGVISANTNASDSVGQTIQYGPVGTKSGNNYVTLSTSQTPLPLHSHSATFSPTTGSQLVNIPATPSTLAANTKVQALVAAPSSATQSPGNGSVLTAASSVGPTPVKIYAPSGSTGTMVDLGGVSTTLSGSAGTQSTNVTVQTVTGGTVTVGLMAQAASSPVRTQSPYVAMTACIATYGLYPVRP